jgi:hypothetical protein
VAGWTRRYSETSLTVKIFGGISSAPDFFELFIPILQQILLSNAIPLNAWHRYNLAINWLQRPLGYFLVATLAALLARSSNWTLTPIPLRRPKDLSLLANLPGCHAPKALRENT